MDNKAYENDCIEQHYPESNYNEPQLSNQRTHPKQVKSFGTKSAFTFVETISRQGTHTINVESAKKIDGSRAFDWKKKIILQVTNTELPILATVLLGLLPNARFDSHGDQNKWLEVINQNKNFFLKSGGTNLGMNVAPLPITEAYMAGLLVLGQLSKNFDTSSEATFSVLRRMAIQLNDSSGYNKPK